MLRPPAPDLVENWEGSVLSQRPNWKGGARTLVKSLTSRWREPCWAGTRLGGGGAVPGPPYPSPAAERGCMRPEAFSVLPSSMTALPQR